MNIHVTAFAHTHARIEPADPNPHPHRWPLKPDSWLDNAVLIYAPRKSGSTMLQNLLDGGDQMFVYPTELKVKRLAKNDRLTDAEYQSHGLLPRNGPVLQQSFASPEWTDEAYSQYNGSNVVGRDLFDRTAYDAFWDLQSSIRQPLRDLIRRDVASVFCSSNQHDSSPRRWCAKEVGGRANNVIATWRNMFPQGKVVLLRRAPLSVIRAILNDRRRNGIRPSLLTIAKHVFQSVRNDREIRDMQDEPWAICVRYEDLVRSPTKEIQRICSFLKIGFSPIQVRPTLFGEPTVVKTSSRPSDRVFVDHSPWRRGLTLREKVAISLFYPIARLVSELQGWRPFNARHEPARTTALPAQ